MYRVRVYDAQLRKQTLTAGLCLLAALVLRLLDDRDAALPLRGPLGPDAAGRRLCGGAT